ncbi:uracil DNA glycosylase superfamily protein [Hoeflea sp. IMCC20628]|uniref:hypothetical protein n=1 Tax=Hoeflea sp. IMCC20628 TaxID=1620421 RepID=UPI00063BDA39|nr:hypothetical protein [Hoeflea sp. IMCC20628]AKI03198.1 uracil DNA glycosylase superfamily protein [Hoeflea sp. IMCC20628]
MNNAVNDFSDSRCSLARHFHDLTQITRSEIFGDTDAQLRPINLTSDSAIMFSGYVGSGYEVNKGILLLGINPGGGGDAYEKRSLEDELFYPLLKDFRGSSEKSALDDFELINKEFATIVKGWNLWRILEPTLSAAGATIDDVAYMNIVPYRTRDDKFPPSLVRKTAWEYIVAPTLKIISPRAVIALGKKAGSIVDTQLRGRQHVYCVPRTIGDSYISEQARLVLSDIRKDFFQR